MAVPTPVLLDSTTFTRESSYTRPFSMAVELTGTSKVLLMGYEETEGTEIDWAVIDCSGSTIVLEDQGTVARPYESGYDDFVGYTGYDDVGLGEGLVALSSRYSVALEWHINSGDSTDCLLIARLFDYSGGLSVDEGQTVASGNIQEPQLLIHPDGALFYWRDGDTNILYIRKVTLSGAALALGTTYDADFYSLSYGGRLSVLPDRTTFFQQTNLRSLVSTTGVAIVSVDIGTSFPTEEQNRSVALPSGRLYQTQMGHSGGGYGTSSTLGTSELGTDYPPATTSDDSTNPAGSLLTDDIICMSSVPTAAGGVIEAAVAGGGVTFQEMVPTGSGVPEKSESLFVSHGVLTIGRPTLCPLATNKVLVVQGRTSYSSDAILLVLAQTKEGTPIPAPVLDAGPIGNSRIRFAG